MAHKHKWYETTLMKSTKDRKSYACKCGSWKVEMNNEQEIKLEKWKVKHYKNK